MSKRTIDETGKDVPQQQGRAVVEVLCLRPDPVMGWLAEWLLFPGVSPDGWVCTQHMRMRIILDNES